MSAPPSAADDETARLAIRSYRIGYLNPWRQAAENQAFFSLAIAAGRLGHELVQIKNSDQIIEADLDFVLAIHPNQPKTTDLPTFGVIHSPRALLLEHDRYCESLLSYDGHLTIAPSLDRFLRAFCVGVERRPHVGYFFHHTAQRQFIRCDVEKLAQSRALRLCYFGTNWDRRDRPLFRALSRRQYMRIYGPPGAWDYLRGGYCGSVPFDGHSVQKVYAGFGAGLATLSRQHVIDDVVSSRIFEIASVGAVAVCADMPWMRQHFGDTVYYYDQLAATATILDQIDGAVGDIERAPKQAAERARAARAICDERFAAEIMLQNAIDYYEEWRRGAKAPRPMTGDPLIDVVVRVGRRPPASVLRALQSIDRQTAGRFRVVLVRLHPMDLSAIAGCAWQRIVGFHVCDAPGGGSAAALDRGLKAVVSPLFAVLDEDDFWLADHIAALLGALRRVPPGRGYAYSGHLTVDEGSAGEAANARERREIASLVPIEGDIGSVARHSAICAFLAASDLLPQAAVSPDADAEDWEFQARLFSRAEPVFSYRASACVTRREGAGDVIAQKEQEMASVLRLQSTAEHLRGKIPDQSVSIWPRLSAVIQQINAAKINAGLDRAKLLLLRDSDTEISIHEDDVERREIPLSEERLLLSGQSRLVRHAGEPALLVLPESKPWAYGATLQLDAATLFSGRQSIVLEFAPVVDAIGAGILNQAGTDFQARAEIPVSIVPVEAWLGIEDAADVSAIVIYNLSRPAATAGLLCKAWVVRERPAS